MQTNDLEKILRGSAVNYKIFLILILFLGVSFAQNTDKESSQRSESYILTEAFENTLDVLRFKSIDASGTVVAPIYKQYTTMDSLYFAGTDTATATWQNLGAVIDMRGYTQLNIYTSIDINNTTDLQFRALGKRTLTKGSYLFMVETISSTDIKVDPEYTEFNTDADQHAILRVEAQGVPFIQLQYKGTMGATPNAKIDSTYINKIWR